MATDGPETKTEIEVTIDSKWHAERVSMYKRWIEWTKERITNTEEMLAAHKEHLAREEQWLVDAIRDQGEFENGK